MGRIGRRRRCGCAWLLALTLGATATPARAAPPATVTVAATPDGCPAAGAVAAAVGQLLPTARVSAARGLPGEATVQIEDLGDRFRVRFDGTVREVPEPARDCAERARTASVIVALALDPPAVSPDGPTVARAPAVAAAAPAPARRRWRLLLQADLAIASAPDVDAVDGVAAGGAVRALAGGEHFGLALGVGVVGPLSERLAAGRVALLRTPCDLDLYAALRRGRWEGVVEAGLAVGSIRMTGQDVVSPQTTTRAEVGVRAAATMRLWAGGRIAPFLGVETLVLPSPHELYVSAIGVAGHTPRVWLTVHAGVALRAY